MHFVLHYRGTLRANGRPDHKHDLRIAFHQQIATLWSQLPLSELREYLRPQVPNDYGLYRPLNGFKFAPLVTSMMQCVAELNIKILRPEPPGNLITQGGDIDNRLKTLFDALTVPRHANALPNGISPTADQEPFYCLLEDDNLITSVAVRNEQMLEPCIDPTIVDVWIDVTTKVFRRTIGNDAWS